MVPKFCAAVIVGGDSQKPKQAFWVIELTSEVLRSPFDLKPLIWAQISASPADTLAFSRNSINPRAAGGHQVAPSLRFVKYLRNLMSYERETWHSFK